MADPKLIDLDPFSIAELEALTLRIGEEIARKRAAGRQWLREHGSRIVEAEAPKYHNPDNATQTWSGKGKRPSWVEEALAAGKQLDDLLTYDNRPVPRRPGGLGQGSR